jgi:hypothetical protein
MYNRAGMKLVYMNLDVEVDCSGITVVFLCVHAGMEGHIYRYLQFRDFSTFSINLKVRLLGNLTFKKVNEYIPSQAPLLPVFEYRSQ